MNRAKHLFFSNPLALLAVLFLVSALVRLSSQSGGVALVAVPAIGAFVLAFLAGRRSTDDV